MAGSERSPGDDEAVLTRWLVVLVIAGIVGMVALAAVTDNDAGAALRWSSRSSWWRRWGRCSAS